MVLVAEVKRGKVTGKTYETLCPESPYTQAARLSELEIRLLICGAISLEFASAIEMCGIRIIPFIAGDVHQVLDAYQRGTLLRPSFRMPGCGMRHRNRFRGGHR